MHGTFSSSLLLLDSTLICHLCSSAIYNVRWKISHSTKHFTSAFNSSVLVKGHIIWWKVQLDKFAEKYKQINASACLNTTGPYKLAISPFSMVAERLNFCGHCKQYFGFGSAYRLGERYRQQTEAVLKWSSSSRYGVSVPLQCSRIYNLVAGYSTELAYVHGLDRCNLELGL